MYKRAVPSLLAILGLMAVPVAQAEIQPGFYVGAGVGNATFEVDDVDFDESDTAFKVFGGYAFNQYFAVELSYFDGGAPKQRFVAGPSTGSVAVDISGLTASMVGRLPLSDMFSIFGKVGFASYDYKVIGRVGNTTVFSEDGTDEDLSYGIGAALNFAQRFELRAEYEAVDISDGSFNVVSLSGMYRF